VEEHRRKGFATIACAAFIKHHLRQGLLPMWQCDFDNFASQSLAEKLGFHYLGNVYFVSALTKFWDSQ
jgi:RimJ/RimL family protein N-acetyltransferase